MQHLWDLCSSLKVFISLQWAWKEPSPAAVLLRLTSVEMGWWGPACPCSQTCDPETPPHSGHPPTHTLCCREQRRQTRPWAIRNPGFGRGSYYLVACVPRWEMGQNHDCSCLAGQPSQWLVRHQGLRGKLATHSPWCPNGSVSGSRALVANLPGLDQSVISLLVRRRHLLPCLRWHNEGPCTFVKTRWVFYPLWNTRCWSHSRKRHCKTN